MQLEDRFEVAAPPERVWEFLNDVPRVLPCMPGAELQEVVGPDQWKAKMSVKMGPIALQFGADVKRDEVDDAERRVQLAIVARELKGRGSARATMRSTVEPDGEGTRVSIVTDVAMQGAVAQYGGGIVADVAGQLTKQFAACLAGHVETPAVAEPAPEGPMTPAAAAPPPPTAAAKPVGGLRIMLRALWRSLGSRLRGRGRPR